MASNNDTITWTSKVENHAKISALHMDICGLVDSISFHLHWIASKTPEQLAELRALSDEDFIRKFNNIKQISYKVHSMLKTLGQDLHDDLGVQFI